MNPRRAGAAVPNALSFARSAMRELVRGRWRIEKLRFDLDAEGRGEILYRLAGGKWNFHFFLVSTKLPEEQKLDRNWAQTWDAMGVLCQGAWTPEREARLRIEVPKQRAGYADYDTLVYARGNRSGRVFEHVVESLAAGRQPDAGLIARIGYILRTTAFIANGQLGTRSFAGFEPDHPFRRPYHAQMCSAFMLREYVFDLVDHMARARNPDATRLDPSYRRYLGLGNAAATGLVAFIANHPHLMHRWCLAHEAALAEAKRRGAAPRDDATQRFARLLDKAIRYYREGEGQDTGVFTSASTMADDLARARAVLDVDTPWTAVTQWSERHLQAESLEVLNAIALELYPDVVEAAADAFQADERFDVRPAMSLAVLRQLVRENYGWALADAHRDPVQNYFWWYRPTKTPRDVKRGIRGLAAELEWETSTDTVLRVQELWRSLKHGDNRMTVAELLCAHPGFRHIVARVQSLAGLDYAEMRVNWLSKAFLPFAPVRFVLAFYGMEKFESVMPKQVRGSFLQGAPIAEDVEQGLDGVWPFPLKPVERSEPEALALLPAPNLGAVRVVAAPPERQTLRIAPGDLARAVQTALQARGAALGVAEEAANMVMFAQACGQDAVGVLLSALESQSEARLAQGTAALLAAPAALDLACARAQISPEGVGAEVVVKAQAPFLLGEAALRAAERGLLGLVVWRDDPLETGRARIGFSLAGPGAAGPWYAFAPTSDPAAVHAVAEALSPAASQAAERLEPGSFAVVCMRPPPGVNCEGIAGKMDLSWNGAELARRRAAWPREGLTITREQYDSLNRAAAALWVPEQEEQRLRPNESTDALKVF
jgi:hypothetical protein